MAIPIPHSCAGGRSLTSVADMRRAARDLHALGPRYVLIKGGHLGDLTEGDQVLDVLFDGHTFHEFSEPFIRWGHGDRATPVRFIAYIASLAVNVAAAFKVNVCTFHVQLCLDSCRLTACDPLLLHLVLTGRATRTARGARSRPRSRPRWPRARTSPQRCARPRTTCGVRSSAAAGWRWARGCRGRSTTRLPRQIGTRRRPRSTGQTRE